MRPAFRFVRWIAAAVGILLLLVLTLGRSDEDPTSSAGSSLPVTRGEPYLGPEISEEDGVKYGFLSRKESDEFCERRRMASYGSRNKRRKVYDMFLINAELDWLEIRMRELSQWVDYFIILESETTFQGTAKPLHLNDYFDNYQQFHDQIIRGTVNLTAAELPKEDTWKREHYARNALLDQAIASLPEDKRAEQGDVLLVSDIDEIPRPSTVVALRNCAFPPRVTLRSHFYYYSFQWLHHGEQWPHPQATYFNGLDGTVKPESLRTGKSDMEFYNAAWHCSSCVSSLQLLLDKLASFSHKVYNHPYILDRQKLLRKIRNGEDILERKDQRFNRIDNNMDIPQYLTLPESRLRFKYMLDRDPPNGNFFDSNGVEKPSSYNNADGVV